MQPLVSIIVVTFNSLPFIGECVASVRDQTHAPWELIVIDNASTDGTVEFLQSSGIPNLTLNRSNLGFAVAQNQGIRRAAGEWVLSLNPDVILHPAFLAKLLEAAQGRSDVGSVCGKLLRWRPGTPEPLSRVLDSAGMYFRPDLRHLDRGAGVDDEGQYDGKQLVFGATGAAALYRRAMIEDISIAGEFFDEAFFSYREDADLAWRAQLMAWKCLHVGDAVGWHVRRVTPERREQLPPEINWHSVKNRFLMRIKNAGWTLYVRCFAAATWRDLMVLGYAVLKDRRLLSALTYPIWNVRAIIKKRRAIQQRRRVSDAELLKWFNGQAVSRPFSEDSRADLAEQKAG